LVQTIENTVKSRVRAQIQTRLTNHRQGEPIRGLQRSGLRCGLARRVKQHGDRSGDIGPQQAGCKFQGLGALWAGQQAIPLSQHPRHRLNLHDWDQRENGHGRHKFDQRNASSPTDTILCNAPALRRVLGREHSTRLDQQASDLLAGHGQTAQSVMRIGEQRPV
jgi:hypothetical protein